MLARATCAAWGGGRRALRGPRIMRSDGPHNMLCCASYKRSTGLCRSNVSPEKLALQMSIKTLRNESRQNSSALEIQHSGWPRHCFRVKGIPDEKYGRSKQRNVRTAFESVCHPHHIRPWRRKCHPVCLVDEYSSTLRCTARRQWGRADVQRTTRLQRVLTASTRAVQAVIWTAAHSCETARTPLHIYKSHPMLRASHVKTSLQFLEGEQH